MKNTNEMPTLAELQLTPLPKEFNTLSGPLRYTMTNDALFHIVFEANPEALKAFLCSLLHLIPEEITSVEVTNPIRFGSSIYAKNFVLDLRLLLNNQTVINLEMQVEKLSFWKERSLGYLCRSFDNLNKGNDYLNTKPAVHVGILDFELFPEHPEFFSTYHLSNDITHQKYSDNFRLSVLQLGHTELATEEDRFWQLDLWAQFFKADTWEEIQMLAEKKPYIFNAAKTIYRVTEDERVRQMCEAREEGEKHSEPSSYYIRWSCNKQMMH
ncbi:MAG: Rpn family recombination-promoting nuclease/putative transposase [Lachnospiraceae bacterium]|nr:Rpn family recombination-promoting nuclease/putative transposase [Lachnospiraceae bacterium]